MNHVVVSGASGFIGRHLVTELAGQGVRVTALHRRPVDPSMITDGVTWVAADVTDKASLAAALAPGADVVFHLAAALVGPTWDWEWHDSVGVAGTTNVIDAAVAAGVPRFVHISSEVVYAPDAPSPLTEQSPLVEHVEFAHPYTRQKLLAEMAVWRADTEGRIAATVVRPARTIGAGDPGLLGAMNNLFGNAAGRVFDDWSSQVPVVVVDDLVRGIVLAASAPAEHRAYNMATSKPVTKAQLRDAFVDAGFSVEPPPMAKRILTGVLRAPARVFGLDRDVTGERPRISGMVRRVLSRGVGEPLPNRMYDATAADTDLGWRGEMDYRVAVRQAVEWAHAQQQTEAAAPS